MANRNQGIQSRNVKRVDQRLGKGAKAINHAGVAEIGIRVGDHVTEQGSTGWGGVGVFSTGPGFNKAPYGNAVAASPQCGPGGSRSVSKPGSQGVHGEVDRGNANSAPRFGDVMSGRK